MGDGQRHRGLTHRLLRITHYLREHIMGLTVEYVVRRLLLFLLIVWVTATINFIVPRLAPGDPIGAIIGRMESQGQKVENAGEIIAEYRRFFGLDEPLPVQYVKYLS